VFRGESHVTRVEAITDKCADAGFRMAAATSATPVPRGNHHPIRKRDIAGDIDFESRLSMRAPQRISAGSTSG
jgi:hypothetical protein